MSAVRPVEESRGLAGWPASTQWQTLAGLVSGRWGWLPLLSLNAAAGLLISAVANTAARQAQAWAEPLFWLGLVLLFVPVALRVAAPGVAAHEAVGLIAMLGLALYAVKLLHSPLDFTFHDEFYHWRSTEDVVTGARLLLANPLLPVSSLYPGLGAVSAATVSSSGISYFGAGVLLTGISRLVLVLALYLFYSEVSGSARVAGLATVIYMANPNFLFFDAQYSYESLALPLAVVALYATARYLNAQRWNRTRMAVLALLSIAAVVVTHHITAYALAGFLVVWTIVGRIWKPAGKGRSAPIWLALSATILALVWLLIAPQTIGYLWPHISGAANELIGIISGNGSGRQLFQSTSGQGSPFWERLVALGAAVLLVVGLGFGLRQIWKRQRTRVLPVLLGLCALLYPASLALRLTGKGWESSNRSSEFLFVALGFVVAVAVVELWLAGGMAVAQRVMLGACLTLVFCGGVIAGWPPAFRLPGPYFVDLSLVGERSVRPEGVQAAEWTLANLGASNTFAADATNMLLLGSYGRQNPTSTISGGINANWILYSARINDDQRGLLARGEVTYLMVDQALRTAPALVRPYYPNGDINRALDKFDALPGVSRLFDSGNIEIYDVRSLAR